MLRIDRLAVHDLPFAVDEHLHVPLFGLEDHPVATVALFEDLFETDLEQHGRPVPVDGKPLGQLEQPPRLRQLLYEGGERRRRPVRVDAGCGENDRGGDRTGELLAALAGEQHHRGDVDVVVDDLEAVAVHAAEPEPPAPRGLARPGQGQDEVVGELHGHGAPLEAQLDRNHLRLA